jgi:hypothetical protein
VAAALGSLNERLMARVNETGEFFLSHTRLHDRFAIRIALGNLHTEHRHVERVWQLICELGAAEAASMAGEWEHVHADTTATARAAARPHGG